MLLMTWVEEDCAVCGLTLRDRGNGGCHLRNTWTDFLAGRAEANGVHGYENPFGPRLVRRVRSEPASEGDLPAGPAIAAAVAAVVAAAVATVGSGPGPGLGLAGIKDGAAVSTIAAAIAGVVAAAFAAVGFERKGCAVLASGECRGFVGRQGDGGGDDGSDDLHGHDYLQRVEGGPQGAARFLLLASASGKFAARRITMREPPNRRCLARDRAKKFAAKKFAVSTC